MGQQFHLQPVEYLLSSGSNINRVIVLGMLTQLKENRFYIEDPTGCVPLDLSQTISFYCDILKSRHYNPLSVLSLELLEQLFACDGLTPENAALCTAQ